MSAYLLASKSCQRDAGNGLNQTIRDTWGKDVQGADLKFFVGRGAIPLKDDEVKLDCADDYESLPHKTKAICKWMLERDYGFIFLCDTDTYVRPDRLLASGFEQYDFMGSFNGPIGVPNAMQEKYWAWCSGGNGYWLSRRAAELVADAQSDGDWAEDRITGQILGPYIHRGELKAFSHDGYEYARSAGSSDERLTRITSHFCVHGRGPKFNLQLMQQWMVRKFTYNVRTPGETERARLTSPRP